MQGLSFMNERLKYDCKYRKGTNRDKKMEEPWVETGRLKSEHDNINSNRDMKAQMARLDHKEKIIKKRLKALEKKKRKLARFSGYENATEDDLVEINAGGTIMVAKRSTLTQLEGGRLAALFIGRWDKILRRDSSGRIFLDVNPVCFRAILDHLNELAISSDENPPDPPRVRVEYKHILRHQLELFGLVLTDKTPGSKIIKDDGCFLQLHDWLGDSDGELSLLYQGSIDGFTGSAFHTRCDNNGATLTIIETTCGLVLGGYSSAPWTSSGQWIPDEKAFLFGLSGLGFSSPHKMNLKNTSHTAVFHYLHHGPHFGSSGVGCNLRVQGSNVYVRFGKAYESDPSWTYGGNNLSIKEMEVFEVIDAGDNQAKSKITKPLRTEQVNHFSKKINAKINARGASLEIAKEELLNLEDSFKDEATFISFFASGWDKDVVTLDVGGTSMVTCCSTLQLCKESTLASKISCEENRKRNRKPVKEWNTGDVVAWLNHLDEIPESVVNDVINAQVTGRELLGFDVSGTKNFGVTRKRNIILLLNEIKKLKKADNETVVLIEDSTYCFEKILDHLRLECSFMKGLVKAKHCQPIVRAGEKERYQKVLDHLFPGDSSKIFEGDCGASVGRRVSFEGADWLIW